MRKVLLVVLLIGVGVGLYRGWLVLASHDRNGSNKFDVTLTVDSDKAKEDARKVNEKTTELGERARDSLKSANPESTR